MAKKTGAEQDILEQAIQAVARETGIRLRTFDRESPGEEQNIDAVLRIDGSEREIPAKIKNWAQHAHVGALIHRVQQLPRQGMLVADYVNPRMADKLRQQGVQFIDTAGNAYIDQPPVYVYVTGRKQQRSHIAPPREGVGRAFEPKGLQVIFAFLRHPDLVNAPYREISARAGVAVGTVGWLMKGLKAAGFILEEKTPKKRRLIHCSKLLARWVEAYPEKLRPKLLMGVFAADDPYWWRRIDVATYGGCWGGEVAAAQYTEGYLKPQVATLYLPKPSRTQLLRDARLRKATEWGGTQAAKALIYHPFWPGQPMTGDTVCTEGLVHPILAYADLIATAEPRNLEAARIIHDQHIAQYCRED
ncbi:MAG TPA: hypothetical protein ENK26_12275 [Gammaproteobacteria bacterium]|nr:hypothetical protein [Gammaproteobacteria bacterium]